MKSMTGNHAGRKGGRRAQALHQHTTKVTILFLQATHIILPCWRWIGHAGLRTGSIQRKIVRRGCQARLIPREGLKTWRAWRCQMSFRHREWSWWQGIRCQSKGWHQWSQRPMWSMRQGAHGTGIHFNHSCHSHPFSALLLALTLSFLVVIMAVLAVVAIVTTALGMEAATVAGAIKMIC